MGIPVVEFANGREPHDTAIMAKAELYNLFGKGTFVPDEILDKAAALSDHGVCALRAATWRKLEGGELELNIPSTPGVCREIDKYKKFKKRPGRKIVVAP